MESKYVIGLSEDEDGKQRLEAILFSKTVTHRDVAQALFGGRVVSAGFFCLSYIAGRGREVKTTGRSESLQVGRQDFDADYIARALGLIPEPLADEILAHHYTRGVQIIEQRHPDGYRRETAPYKWSKGA